MLYATNKSFYSTQTYINELSLQDNNKLKLQLLKRIPSVLLSPGGNHECGCSEQSGAADSPQYHGGRA